MTISYDSEELIKELKEDIKEFGENHKCYLFYIDKDGFRIYDNYDFITEEKPLTKEEKTQKYIITTFKKALKKLENQDNVLIGCEKIEEEI